MEIDHKYFNSAGIIKATAPIEIKQQNFINKARKIYGNKYNYSKVKYINAKTKVTIICPMHGDYLAIPNNHLNGTGGCQRCAGNVKHTKEEFISLVKTTHGDVFDLSKFSYVNYKTASIVTCKVCGYEFCSTPNNLLSNKVGCLNCHVLNIANRYIYIFSTVYNNRIIYKVGISSKPKRRLLEVCNDSGQYWNLEYTTKEPISTYTARYVEKQILNNFNKVEFHVNFNGSKELIYAASISDIINRIENEITNI